MTKDGGLKRALLLFARADLKIAKKEGSVIITHTKIGSIEILYDGTEAFLARQFGVLSGDDLTEWVSEWEMTQWLSSQYKIG